MSVVYSVKATGAWSDFSVATAKVMTPSSDIAVGHRAFIVLSTTVDGGVSPGASGWGAIDSISDPRGNTWNRDNFAGPVDGVDSFCTVEVWSAYVATSLPSSGWSPTITPDARGLSAWWAVYDVAGLIENGGVSSPLDKTNNANDAFTNTWSTGTTGTLAQADEWVLTVHGCGSGSPAAPWLTDTAGFTSDSQQSGSAPGSAVAFAALSKTVSAATSLAGTGTTTSNQRGASLIATYKILVNTDATVTGTRAGVAVTGRLGTVPTAAITASAARLIVTTGNRW